MIVGVDFDNTVVRYDAVFAAAAADAGFAEAAGGGAKRALRERLRAQPGGEERWTWLQAQVYGPRMDEAVPFAGFAAFARRCRALGVPLYLVSHKSAYAAAQPNGTNLREAARRWLDRKGLASLFAGIFFEDDRAAKIERIRALACTHFVDDLIEVFREPRFPAATAAWLFDPAGEPSTEPPLRAFASWGAVEHQLQAEHGLWSLATSLAGEPIRTLAACVGGGNNRLYRVELAGERAMALKRYGVPDERGRLAREVAAGTLLRGRGLPVAELLASDAEAGAALFVWIDGASPGEPREGDVSEALALIRAIDALRFEPAAAAVPAAAEAGLSVAAIWEQIGQRLSRLRACPPEPGLPEVLDALDGAFVAERERFAQGRDPGSEVAPEYRTLSPSDFGFHNALRRPDGHLAFLDFEYFGWDDPVKLVADFTLHPGMQLRAVDSIEWREGASRIFARDADFATRLRDCFPTYALKWCTILLNEFRPDVWKRRAAARPGGSWEAAKATQLAKARALLERIDRREWFGG